RVDRPHHRGPSQELSERGHYRRTGGHTATSSGSVGARFSEAAQGRPPSLKTHPQNPDSFLT
ncbi:hypothetical protein ACYOEI_26710, partial [Singulisphaera rosea]